MDYPFYIRPLKNITAGLIDELATTAVAEQGWIEHNYFIRTELKTLPRDVHSDKLRGLIGQVTKELEAFFPVDMCSGYALNCLEPGKEIAEHSDINTRGSSQPMDYVLYHKVHIPLVTNPGVVSVHRRSVYTNNWQFHMEKGRAYLYNDYIWHGGRNDGADPRIHLILKYRDLDWSHRTKLLEQVGISKYNTYELIK